MDSRRGSIAKNIVNYRENNTAQTPAQLLQELKGLATAIAIHSTQIISLYQSPLNELFGESSQLVNLIDCLLSHHQQSHHLIYLSDDNVLFTYIDKVTALQTNLSLILKNAASSMHECPAVWGSAQNLYEALREFAKAYRSAAIIAAGHCRREFKNLFQDNCQQTTAAQITARALLILAKVQPHDACTVYQFISAPDQLIFYYECINESSISCLKEWLVTHKVKSASIRKDESQSAFFSKNADSDSEGTANFQLDEELETPVASFSYEVSVDAAEFSSAIMPMIREQAVQISKTPRGHSMTNVVASSAPRWDSDNSSSAEIGKSDSEDGLNLSELPDETTASLGELTHTHKLFKSGSGRNSPRSATQSPRSQKNGSGMLTALKALGSSTEKSDFKEGVLKRSLK